MHVGDREFDICVGDSITITAKTPHSVVNAGSAALKILCVCHPPHADDDTVLS